MLPENQMQQQQGMGLEQMNRTAMNVVENVCGILCMPVEIILRPFYGTRYFPIPVVFLTTMMMIFLPIVGDFAAGAANMIPFHKATPIVGLFGIGAFAYLYFIVSFAHGFRLWRRMVHMELEQNSQFEGPGMPFFRLIPGGKSFWVTRILLEPAFVFASAWLLGHLFILQPGLTSYLYLAAMAMAMKNYIVWYRAWEFLRINMDVKYTGPIIAKIVRNEASREDLASIHYASVSKNISSDLCNSLAEHIRHIIGS